jgi:hypothetical protein
MPGNFRLERRLEKLVSAPACRIVHHAGASGGVVSEKQWAESRDTWIPLRKAVFVFGMTEDEEAAAIHDQPFLGLSKDDFELIATDPESGHQNLKKKLNNEANDAEIAERATAPFSRRQLAKMLQDNSEADSAEIDPNTSTFLFRFRVSGGGASLLGVSPWRLECKKRDHCPEPQLAAEALFNKEGLVRISDEEAALHKKQDQSARKAAGLVFRQFMVRSFDRAISTKSVVLYARVGDLSAPFKQLAADVWPLLDVADWENGVAIAADGTVYWSIHADRQSAEAKAHSRRQAGWKIDHFVKKYIDGEKAAGRVPTLMGCEKEAKKAGIRGHRGRIRDAFKSAGVVVKVGRPGNSPD